jgi:hypothetical protein
MTLSTIRAECSVMLVLVAVTIDASYGSILETLRRVTAVASNLRMLAEQRESCEIMVEG